MSHEPKGSTPGPINETHHLTKVNTYPSVEFTIPSGPPELFIAKCPSRRTQGGVAPELSEKNERSAGDEEAQSVVMSNEGPYPEGGLQAWLVVLGAFCASIVGFGMM